MKQATGRKIISQMDTIETSGFHTDNNVFELMVIFYHIRNHLFHKGCTFPGVFHRLHPDVELLIEIKCRNNMDTGCNVNPNKQC